MSASGLDVFDRTLETTHIWLNEICNDLGPDKQVAWKVLSTVLHKLRDRLTINLAAHLGAQLPLLIRGVYYDQFEPGHMPSELRSRDDFVAEVAEWLRDTRWIPSVPRSGRDSSDSPHSRAVGNASAWTRTPSGTTSSRSRRPRAIPRSSMGRVG